MENNIHLLKMIMKNGLSIALFSDEPTLDELVAHPKYLRMRDNGNEVFISIEDIVAFEILSNRKDLQVAPEVPVENPVQDIAPEVIMEADVSQPAPSPTEA